MRASDARRRASRRQVKCFVPMLDLASGAPELVADLLRACLDTVKCALHFSLLRRTKNTNATTPALLLLTPLTRAPRLRSAANVASVEMDMVKARRARAPHSCCTHARVAHTCPSLPVCATHLTVAPPRAPRCRTTAAV
jgi:hypothetical protein